MRIVLATETFLPHIDGIVTRLTQTITHLRRLGDEILILAPRRHDSPSEYAGARILTIPSMSLPMYPDVRIGSPILPNAIERTITEFNPDIIHTVSPAFLGLGPILSAQRRKIPLVASYHVQYPEYVERYRLNALVPFVKWYLRTVHNKAQLNLATSMPMVRELRERGFHNMHLWRPGVESERFDPARSTPAWRNRLTQGNPDAFLIVCVARLAVEKGIDRLAPVLRSLPGAHLALIGDGPARAQLIRIFDGLPVTFAGMIRDKDELASAYASADVFVLPSSTETLGLVALEAMSAGKPAIVANRGGLSDLVVHEKTGYLIDDPEHPQEMIERLRFLQHNTDRLLQMSHAARLHAEQFSWEQTALQLREYYQQVLGAPVASTQDVIASLHR